MAQTTTWFLTGTSRGIGLELVNQLLADPSNVVIASCRNPESASALKALSTSAKGSLHVVALDVVDEASIKAVAPVVKEILGDRGLDYLVNNAGYLEVDTAFTANSESLVRCFKINTVGPALVSQALLPFINRSSRKVLANITSGLASIALDYGDQKASYSISKTALNMLVYKQAKERPDVITFVVDPGWVKTEMGGEGAMIEAQESASGLLKLFKSATLEQSGHFFKYDSSSLPW